MNAYRLAASAALCCAVAATTAIRAADPAAEKTSFEFNDVDETSLELLQDGKPVLVYNFGEKTLPQVPAAGRRSNYVHPIYGLDGEILTDDFPADHYHHHGLFWGWPHVKIGKLEYDLWKMRGIRFKFIRWLAKDVDANHARLGIENGWFIRDKQVMKEEVWLEVHPATANGRDIDVTLKWTPLEEMTLGGAEGKSYGGVTLRFAPRKNTMITGPSGRASEDLLITKMPWADLSASFKMAPGPSGAALFVDPAHPGFPPEWMTRDYGVLAVGWPGVTPLTLRPDQTTTCRYRVWVHRGLPDAKTIDARYRAYCESISKQ